MNPSLPNSRPDVKSEPDNGVGDPSTNGHRPVVAVLPDVSGMSNAEAAETYAKAGFCVVPIRLGTKNPGSLLGRGWPSFGDRRPRHRARLVAAMARRGDCDTCRRVLAACR